MNLQRLSDRRCRDQQKQNAPWVAADSHPLPAPLLLGPVFCSVPLISLPLYQAKGSRLLCLSHDIPNIIDLPTPCSCRPKVISLSEGQNSKRMLEDQGIVRSRALPLDQGPGGESSSPSVVVVLLHSPQ